MAAEKVIKSLVILNKLPLPDELIDIIKDYVYYDSTHVLQSFLKSQMITTLYTMDVSYRLIRNRENIVRGIEFYKHYYDSDRYGLQEIYVRDIVCSCCGEYARYHKGGEQLCYTRNLEDLRYDSFMLNETKFASIGIHKEIKAVEGYHKGLDKNDGFVGGILCRCAS